MVTGKTKDMKYRKRNLKINNHIKTLMIPISTAIHQVTNPNKWMVMSAAAKSKSEKEEEKREIK